MRLWQSGQRAGGRFLYSRAFQMMVDAGNMRIMQVLADATNVIAEGEVLQLMNMHDASLDEEGYLHVIRSKTAKLFEASAAGGPSWPSGTAGKWKQACATMARRWARHSRSLTMCWTTTATRRQMGKNLGDDLREGKATLPLIAAMQRGTPDAQREVIADAIENSVRPARPRSLRSSTHRRPGCHACGGSRRRGTTRHRCHANFAGNPYTEVCYNWRLSCLSGDNLNLHQVSRLAQIGV
jgi:hypothetical protein